MKRMNILTYDSEQFYLDGKPYTVLSGAMHYFRIPRAYWKDRLLKLKECGFNTVETYFCWNLHEPREGTFTFSEELDVGAFLDIAAELGLNVILRPGPFICAEWEFGGLPAWLLSYPGMELRCNNELFLEKVRNYIRKVSEIIRPHLAVNGGNVFMIQVENEYGSYGDDKAYLRAVADIYRKAGIDCLFFTSDGPEFSMMTGGALEDLLCVANFGSDVPRRTVFLKEYRPDQPVMCGEFWGGWFDHWFEQHHTRPMSEVVDCVRDFLEANASFNFYMFHGGTNFGFTSGANYGEKYEPTTTSYDYCAPLTEAGDRTDLYYRIRDLFKEKFGSVPKLTAKETEKKAYGKIELCEKAMLFDQLDILSEPVFSETPKYMEEIGQDYGYLLYESEIKGPRNDWQMHADAVHDRAEIFVNGTLKGVFERWDPESQTRADIRLPLRKGETAKLQILVENMGRVNYGHKLKDCKGIRGVGFGVALHFGWKMYPLPMTDLSGLTFRSDNEHGSHAPAFYRAFLSIPDTPKDSFVRMNGLTKGFVMVNGNNLGRYFNPAGPQKTLYVPAPFLRRGENEIIVFESDAADHPNVEFLDTPVWD